MPAVEERVFKLESVVEEFVKNVQASHERTEAELREFKDEMAAFKRNLEASHERTEAELREFKVEMAAFKRNLEASHERTEAELREFKVEMAAFKDEMAAFKEEMRRDRIEMNKKWGELANKMGTLAEDMVAPNIKGIAKRYFGCEDLEDFMVRRERKHSKDKTRTREFDIIAVCDGMVLINETKSTPRMQYIDDFISVLKEFFDFFPEYRGKRVIPIFASLYLGDNIVSYLTKNGIYAMAIKDDTMDLLNYAAVA